ncbi:hypothetical protein LOCC1_G008950 [Lachnellula occidentalis]|uniref:CENP-V/GFA domain-containing protein n=1 Tax=Lachnellula occidentalis TaxID=215460 RepID=A0A8H8RCR4_9HELO|nr:hypothetical protein LOCC1_G008950 [Lachnellula occidentalis]
MPLPPHKFVVKGGCNCGAIRYKISIPEIEHRPLHPSSTSSSTVHLPFIAIDHCNDCRRATGAILPLWICSPISMITSSVILRSTTSLPTEASQRKAGPDDHEPRTAWLPAEEVFTPGPVSSNSFLTFFESSENRRRSFCGRCGTHLAYAALPMPEGWPDMLDIVLGSVDREDLDGEALRPDRQLWWECGIGWVKDLTLRGMEELPRHPDYRIDELVETGA